MRNGGLTVVALGGNALGNTAEEQLRLAKNTARAIADLVESGRKVVVVHGNGPQVGMINLGLETAANAGAIRAPMPFPECGAMSEGYIGYHLQNAIGGELRNRGMKKDVVTVVTQVEVKEDDPAFLDPTKPIGAFYSKEEAERISREKGYVMKEDAGRGWRRVVPSPRPFDIVEKDVIRTLVDNGYLPIAARGGGIPVIRKGNGWEGVAAVIDKDFAAAKLAELLDADMLLILTAVDKVCVNYGKENERKLNRLNVKEAERYCEEGQFAPGSMLPKVKACVSFVRDGRTAVIASLEKAGEAVRGESGTLFTN